MKGKPDKSKVCTYIICTVRLYVLVPEVVITCSCTLHCTAAGSAHIQAAAAAAAARTVINFPETFSAVSL